MKLHARIVVITSTWQKHISKGAKLFFRLYAHQVLEATCLLAACK